MILLIDTHALIWYIEGNKRLRKYVVSVIENTDNTIFVSKASLWEMAIKMSLKKLEMSIPFDQLEKFLEENELIISQAITNNLKIITHDESFALYDVKILK